ncbi:MAG: haloacid dehalogenase-like hydrolase [Gammaproteobacteria bacterium]|nr:haloacid dehalogenase-like hydrolase [Gammaproteobacteria bacterium]
MALAVFDVDGTLVAGPSTEKRLFVELLRHGWLGPAQVLAFTRFGVRHASAFGWLTWKKDKAYLAGLACADVEALVSAWVKRSAPGWWFAPCLERLRRHQLAGDTVVLLSGTPQFLADALVRELGAARAVGTLCATAAGRFLADPPLRHPFGPDKVELVKALCAELQVPAVELFAYGDSVHDLPLLRFAGHPVAVRPDTALRAAAGVAGWEIVGRR